MTEQQQTHVINEICLAVRRERLKRMTVYRKKLKEMSEEQLREEYQKYVSPDRTSP